MKTIAFPKKVKKISKSKAKAKAWKAFSLWIRLKDTEEFDKCIACYTCGTIKPYKEMQAGHGISGRNNAVLFMEEVVRPQCMACNVFARGRYQVFTLKLIKELGMERFEELSEQANVPVQYKTNDYLAIEEKYKSKLEEIKQ